MTKGKIFFDDWCSDDTLLLFDYFKEQNETDYSLKKILTDLHLIDKLAKNEISEGADVFYYSTLPNGKVLTSDFDIAIDVVIDLSVILLHSFKKEVINLSDFMQCDEKNSNAFSIKKEEAELNLLLAELKDFIENPSQYNLAEMMDENDLMILAADCNKVYNEILSYVL